MEKMGKERKTKILIFSPTLINLINSSEGTNFMEKY